MRDATWHMSHTSSAHNLWHTIVSAHTAKISLCTQIVSTKFCDEESTPRQCTQLVTHRGECTQRENRLCTQLVHWRGVNSTSIVKFHKLCARTIIALSALRTVFCALTRLLRESRVLCTDSVFELTVVHWHDFCDLWTHCCVNFSTLDQVANAHVRSMGWLWLVGFFKL